MENLREKIREIIKEMISLNEISITGAGGATRTPGGGAQHTGKKAFKKNSNSHKQKNIYKKLGWQEVPKKIKGSGLEVTKLFN